MHHLFARNKNDGKKDTQTKKVVLQLGFTVVMVSCLHSYSMSNPKRVSDPLTTSTLLC